MKKIRAAQIGIGHDHATAAIGSMRKLTELYADLFRGLAGYTRIHLVEDKRAR